MYSLFKPSQWRYERKFIVSELTKYELESIVKLHPAIFSEIFYERSVNNIYLDTIRFDNYIDNEVGTSKRLKVRIRWYGNLFGFINKPVLEFKIKQGYLGGKVSYRLEPFGLSTSLSLEAIHKMFKKSLAIPDRIKSELINFNFTLLNYYKRKYFQSADKKFRITIDTGMRFNKIEPINNNFLNSYIDYNNTIMEIKYNENNDRDIENITNCFPFRMTKSSKYISGLNYIFG